MRHPKLTLRLNRGARIDISAKKWSDAFEAYIRLCLFAEKAERTARLMARVNKLSSQCMGEWNQIERIMSDYAPDAAQHVLRKVERASQASEATDADSEDK